MPEYQIECGEHRGVIEAKSLGAAWRKLTKNKTEGFAPLARFVEDGVWKYVDPEYLDNLADGANEIRAALEGYLKPDDPRMETVIKGRSGK